MKADGEPASLGLGLLARRPGVAAARWRVDAARQDVAAARAQFYPNINLAAFVGLRAIGLDKLFEGGSFTAGATPALHLPLFDGCRLRAQLEQALAQVNRPIDQQAFTRAADDVFYISALLYLALIGMVWLTHRPPRTAGPMKPSADAAH